MPEDWLMPSVDRNATSVELHAGMKNGAHLRCGREIDHFASMVGARWSIQFCECRRLAALPRRVIMHAGSAFAHVGVVSTSAAAPHGRAAQLQCMTWAFEAPRLS